MAERVAHESRAETTTPPSWVNDQVFDKALLPVESGCNQFAVGLDEEDVLRLKAGIAQHEMAPVAELGEVCAGVVRIRQVEKAPELLRVFSESAHEDAFRPHRLVDSS